MEPYPEFAIEYPFQGDLWLLTMPAKDRAEAEERLKALAWAKVEGEVMAKGFDDRPMQIEKGPDIIERAFLRIVDGVFKLLNLYVRARNSVRSPAPKR